MQARRQEKAHQVGAEDVGKAAAAGEEVALGAQVGQHGGEKRRDAQGKQPPGDRADRVCRAANARPGHRRASVAKSPLHQR